ncbi:MAG TPA: FAD:protein FMN transferase [Thermoanaerobaculia bacterium]|nr:FAD:protein FMN transferase [Thermoanaerobaculia bacterium]
MRTAAIIAALALVPGIAESAVVQRARYLMGTVCEVAVPAGHEAEIESAFAEAKRIESMLSTWTEESELARLNRGAGQASPELRALLDETADWSKKTGGAFDPRVKSLIDVWKTREAGALPDAGAIAEARKSSRIEEGAFGKGYALDRMLARITSAEAMIDFGGQLAVRGELRVTVADPARRDRPVVAFTMRDASLSTSSGSEKTFEIDGRRFSHILDPRTGGALPPRGSVSVIADDALSADILSTALYVMGEDDGLRWAKAHGVAAVFINPTRQIRLSAGARRRARDLELLDRNYSVKE